MFAAIQPRRLYRQVADQIRQRIEGGAFSVGERLPGERELAEELSVSRPTVREALIALEVEGLIHIRMGSGIYVARQTRDRPLSLHSEELEGPFELLRARTLIECAIVEEAALAITPAHVAAMDDVLTRMARTFKDPHQSIMLDRLFHTTICSIIGNAALDRVVGDLFDQRLTPYFTRLASHFESPASWREAFEEHRAIRDAIAAGDPARARSVMRHHLQQSQSRFSRSFDGELESEKGRTSPA
ncbi:FadR/GntR family transcriptional regulator [Phyllobacterium sp. 0TCS1.6C]|jgi:DNA-binding FadR family transcriptional regulator|uniref:FadR/GntR family transcriptional regulator n=1 Tax=unclassified Phyllobacterium TaxID=2638441 RepID=UPI0022648A11|nr:MULTISPECIES: FadR/GntR family transcriptional regulator [unclassified Phyllobacterium]MCX8282389.1 FadR/GntR family transcriptional regulator [Phyllobacterium sp. 0TCS1.6C]MCX8295258.1 FadR/GntR family transcriptional regulator [Phyllobacterium sp. 0TCS1.6A]